MKIVRQFSIFTFLLLSAFASDLLAQAPKVIWKNLQDKYTRFEDIKPVIVNESNQPIYFDCLTNEIDHLGFLIEGSYKTRLLNFEEANNRWFWNVMVCGTESKEERKRQKKEAKDIAKLKKERKYITSGCKVNPKEEFVLDFSPKQWLQLILGFGSSAPYKSGEFKFEITYDWENSEGTNVSESPAFWVAK